MEHLFIKKVYQGYDFCLTSYDYFNFPYRALDKYKFSEANIQTISNRKYTIFYSRMYRLEESFLKMFFEDELSKRDSLTIDDLRNDLVFNIKTIVRDCKRLSEGNAKEDKRDTMTGEILIVTDNQILQVLHNFSCEVIDMFLDKNDITIMAENEILNDPSPLRLMEFCIEDAKKHQAYIHYPIVYGNTTDDFITIRHISGSERKVKKEEYICQW